MLTLYSSRAIDTHNSIVALLLGLTGFYSPGWKQKSDKQVLGDCKQGYEPVKEKY